MRDGLLDWKSARLASSMFTAATLPYGTSAPTSLRQSASVALEGPHSLRRQANGDGGAKARSWPVPGMAGSLICLVAPAWPIDAEGHVKFAT